MSEELNDSTRQKFQDALMLTDNAQAAAMLVLADSMANFVGIMDTFEHQICMGIRKGMYGIDAGDHESLKSQLSETHITVST